MPKSKKKILIVCDDEKNQAFLSLILSEKELSVIKAQSKKKGIELAESENPDLIIYNFDISGFDGGDMASTIRRKQPDKKIPIIFITSLVNEAEEQCQILDGPICFLSKPLNVKRLLQEIDNLL